MDAFSPYIPVLVASIVLFVLLMTNPDWLRGKKYGDKPHDHPDPLITSIVVFLVGAFTAWLVVSKGLRRGGPFYGSY